MSIRFSPRDNRIDYNVVIKLDSSAFSLRIPKDVINELLTSKKVDVSIECTEIETSECDLT